MRIIPNQSEKRFVSCLMKNGKNQSDLIWLIPKDQSEWIQNNPKPSFQSRLMRINPISNWSKPNFQSESIRIIPTLDPFGLIQSEFESIRMNPNQSRTKFSVQINLNQSDLRLIQTEFSIRIKPWIHSDWFNPNESESIRNEVINPIYDWSKPNFQSESIRIIPNLDPFGLIQSKWIRTHPKPCFWSRSIRSMIDRIRIFNQNQSESFRPWIY